MYRPVTANSEILPVSLYKGARIIFLHQISQLYDLHVLIDINYIKRQFQCILYVLSCDHVH